MMDDFAFYALLVGISFYVGWYAREFIASIRVKSFIKNETTKEESKINAFIELKDNMIFMYDKETNIYIGHAEKFLDLENQLKDKFPDKTFAVSHEDMLKLMK